MAKRNKKSRKTRRNNAVATQTVALSAAPVVQDEGLASNAAEQVIEASPALQGPAVTINPIVDVLSESDQDRATIPGFKTAASRPVVEAQPALVAEAATIAAPAPIAVHAPLDDVDEAFFRAGDEIEAKPSRAPEDSIPPVADDIDSKRASLPPTPEVLARRSKFRKFVGAVVALGALVVVGGLGKTVAAGSPSAPAAQPGSETTLVAEAAKPAAKPEQVMPVAQPAAAPQPAVAEEAAKPEEPAPAEAEAKPAEEPADSVAAVPDGKDPRKEALNLLNRGKMADAVPMSRAAIQQDPAHALGYLYLGTALQELGNHKDAIAAYSDCVRNAKQGPVWECRAMGGRQ